RRFQQRRGELLGSEEMQQALPFTQLGALLAEPLEAARGAPELGGRRPGGGDGSGAGAANVAEAKLLLQLEDGRRIDDSAGDSTLHDEVALLGGIRRIH